MSKKLKELRAKVRKYEDTYKHYEKLFLADGIIDAEEKAALDKLKSSTKAILAKIEEHEQKLGWFGKMRNHASEIKENIQDDLSDTDDIVDHSLVDYDPNEASSNTTSSDNDDTAEDNTTTTSPSDNTTDEHSEPSYTVIAGDTGTKIANKLGLNFSHLKKLNPDLKWSKLEIGQSIRIPSNTVVDTEDYTIVSSDTGLKIARKLNIKLSQLKALNPTVKWMKIKPGQVIQVPKSTANTTEEDSPIETSDETNPPTPTNNKSISASVGKKGGNNPEDVRTVQELLQKHGYNISVDGKSGPQTESTIYRFQQAKGTGSDSRVDPGGGTFKALLADKSEDNPNGLAGPLNKPNWISIAEGELGTKEIVGAEHNPRVIEYHATTGGFKTDEVPWCASFVNWVTKKAGKGGTGSGLAMSWAKYGDGTKDNAPAYGAIGVISYGGGKGHVGFVVGKQGSSLLLLGGNQSNMVKISKYAISKFHSFRVPSGYEVPLEAYSFGEAEGDFGSEGDLNSTR